MRRTATAKTSFWTTGFPSNARPVMVVAGEKAFIIWIKATLRWR